MKLAWVLLVWAGVAQAQEPWAGADILVLGEVHDNPAHHLYQAQIVAAVQPRAIVFEMLSSEQVAAVDGLDRSDVLAFGAAFGWEAAGWPDFAIYAPIFAAAPDAVLVGAALPDDQMMAAIETSAAAAFGPDAAAFGLVPLTPADQALRESEQAEAHCGALPPEMLGGMVQAQRLRDAHFAKVTLGALDQYGGPVVLITGSGHARNDRGVPPSLLTARPNLEVWALGQFESDPGRNAPYDAVNVTEPVSRPDPCLAFQ